jgi:hypothetical protein
VSSPSYLTFGGLPEFITDMSDAVSHRISGSFHWQIDMNGLRVGDNDIDLDINLMLVDTGTSYTYLPTSMYIEVITQICNTLK